VSLPYSWIYCMHFLSFFLTWGGGLNLGPCTYQASTLPLEQWAQLYTQFWPNAVKINNEEISQIKFLIPLHTFDAGKLCQSRYHQLWLNPWMICYFPVPDFFLNLLPKKQMVPKSKVKVNVLNRKDQVKIWDLFLPLWQNTYQKQPKRRKDLFWLTSHRVPFVFAWLHALGKNILVVGTS
jgi:hypothetical protein